MASTRPVALLAGLILLSGCAGGPGGGGTDGGSRGGTDGGAHAGTDGGAHAGTDGGSGPTGSLTVTWTFGNKSCDLAGVGTIEIQGTGEADGDAFDKTVSCAKFATGIQIGSLHVEKYDVMVTGYDAAGKVPLYKLASPEVLAIQAGANTYGIDVPSDVGNLEVGWGKFGTYADCTTASVDTIKVTLKDATGKTVGTKSQACGNVTKVTWQNLPAGSYTALLEGQQTGAGTAYATSAPVTVKAGKTQTYTIDLADNHGAFTVNWTINGSTVCGNVATVNVDVFAPTGEIIFQSYPCSDGGETYTDLYAETYIVDLTGSDASGKTLFTGENKNVVVTARASTTYVIDMK